MRLHFPWGANFIIGLRVNSMSICVRVYVCWDSTRHKYFYHLLPPSFYFWYSEKKIALPCVSEVSFDSVLILPIKLSHSAVCLF